MRALTAGRISHGCGAVDINGVLTGFHCRYSDEADSFVIAVAATIRDGKPGVLLEQFRGSDAVVDAEEWIRRAAGA